MTALVLDAGAFIAVDRDDRAMIARLATARAHDLDLRTNAMVLAQVWRDNHGRQAQLARLLRAVEIHPIGSGAGRAAGALLGKAGTSDPIDASIALNAHRGDQIVTSDPDDIRHLLRSAGINATVVTC